MTAQPKIFLVHANAISMTPVQGAFEAQWPQARVVNLLEDSLYDDFKRDGTLTAAMIERFVGLGRYCASAGADAILFTCSAFGPAIDAVKREQRVPVLKPNEALYDEMVSIAGNGGRVALLATFAPTLTAMMAELAEHPGGAAALPNVQTHLVEGAIDALMAHSIDEHHRLIADAARTFPQHDAIALAQFSMAPARAQAEARVTVPVLTTPDGAIRKLKKIME